MEFPSRRKKPPVAAHMAPKPLAAERFFDSPNRVSPLAPTMGLRHLIDLLYQLRQYSGN
jgi:hypothetical protein